MVTVQDLKKKNARHAFLYCAECGAEYSADHRDYFMTPPTETFACCGEPMKLMRKHTVYEEV